MAATINASTSSGIVQTADTSGVLQLQSSSIAALTIDTSQNVGIGTTSPAVKLQVNGAAVVGSTTGGGIGVAADTTTFTPSGSSKTIPNYGFGDNTGGIVASAGYYGLTYYTGQTERMRIDSSGNVLVGTTTYSFSSTNYGIALQPNGETFWIANTPGNLIAFNRNNDGNMFKFFRSGGQVGAVSVTSTNTTYGTSSDYRLKENIVPMTGALDKVAQLNPVTYNWKIDGSDGQGFIAHELQAVLPDAVVGEKDAVDDEGKAKYQNIDTSFLVATLTAAIQELAKASSEQQTIINDLKSRIEALEGAK